MKIRNAIYKNAEKTLIDVEIEHPTFGWIPYTFDQFGTDGISVTVKDFLETAKIASYEEPTLTREEQAILLKESIAQALQSLTVTTNLGHIFDAYAQARQDMADAILASATLNITETVWRLADNSEVTISLEELKEAHALAIQAYAKIKGIGA